MEKENKTEKKSLFYTRVDEVIDFILENIKYLEPKRNNDLIKIIKERYGCRLNMAQKYIAEAKKEIKKIGRQKKEEAYRKAAYDREYLINKMKINKSADYKLALEIMKDRDRLIGLYTPDDKASSTTIIKNFDVVKLSTYQLERIARGEDINKVLLEKDDN